ncbi:MAG: MFS transporter [Dehalococcoidia bacterium]|nr:MFS transporter [Dehalococcoidia bacterium]
MGKRYFYGFNIVAAGFFIQAAGGGALATYGIFFNFIQGDFGWERATISGATSVTFLVMGTAGIICGRVTDRIGPRLIMTVAGLVLGSGYLLMSALTSPVQLYIAMGILVGLGMSTQDVPTLSTIARWFVRRRGMMSGIVKVGTGFGQVAFPLVAGALIAAFGWRNAYLFIGFAVLAMVVVAAQVLRRDPGSMGLRPDGEVAVPGSERRVQEEGLEYRVAVRTRQFWLICVANFLMVYCLVTMLVHLVPHAVDMGITVGRAGLLVSIMGGVSMAARLGMGTAADRIGARRAFLVCFIVLLVGFLWLRSATAMWMLVLYAAADGFARGGSFAVISPMVAELFGTRAHGSLFGIVNFAGTVGGALGPLVAGRTFDLHQSYATVFVLLVVFAAVGILVTLFLKPIVKPQG